MHNFLYLIQVRRDINTDIYKIGKTIQLPEERFKGYEKKTYPLRIFSVDNCHKREKELIAIFNIKFRLARGREYFEGDIFDIESEFCKFCRQEEILKKTLVNSDIINNDKVIKICNSQKIGNFECNKCFHIFNTKQQLERHVESINKCDIKTDFQCGTCLKYFKCKQNLNEHKICKSFNIEKINEIKNKIIINNKEIVHEIKNNEIVNNNEILNDSNHFECAKCYHIFNTKQQLQRHMKSINKCDLKTDFQCKICLKYFKCKQNLIEHKVCKSFNVKKVNQLKISKIII